jgi:hypothetical protein
MIIILFNNDSHVEPRRLFCALVCHLHESALLADHVLVEVARGITAVLPAAIANPNLVYI